MLEIFSLIEMDLAVANEDSGADCSESFHGNGSCNDEACTCTLFVCYILVVVFKFAH